MRRGRFAGLGKTGSFSVPDIFALMADKMDECAKCEAVNIFSQSESESLNSLGIIISSIWVCPSVARSSMFESVQGDLNKLMKSGFGI